MPIDLRNTFDPNSDEGRDLLAGLQGNILQGHGRDHAMHLFICFGRPKDEPSHATLLVGARKWIGEMMSTHVTTAAVQRGDVAKDKVFTMLLLSSRGYEFLGERRPREGAFRDGMRERRHRLNDPLFQQWAPRYKLDEEDIHALVIVAAKEDGKLDAVKVRIADELASFGGSILVDERGRQERDADGRAIEHFGFADGVSQPQFFDDGRPPAKNFDQRTALKLVLEEDRHGDGGYGSFLVYRLLEQNVASFNTAVDKVADVLGKSSVLVGAMAIGRFKNGTPLTTHPEPKPGYDPNHDEDFNYDDDRDGDRCPLHGHIRKVNPRGSLGFLTNLLAREQKRRIARRGITYTEDENHKGLIFMCFQSDISDQFEFIQRKWANKHDFSKFRTGLDPVIGQDGGPQESSDFPKWPQGYDSKQRTTIRFDEHVRLLGGEYFFAPSISGLKELANPK